MYSKSDNIEIMINDEADKIIEELFDSLKNRYQNYLESMKGSESVFNYVHLLYQKYHKINPNRGGSYIDSTDWMKNKKATKNLINKKIKKCFQHALTVVLNHEEIKKDLQRITNTKPFINKYNWEGINFLPEKNDWKKMRKIMQQMLLIFCMLKKKKYILLMFEVITRIMKKSYSFNDLKRRKMALSCSKKLSALLRGKSSKHYGNFYFFNCLHSSRTKNKLESHKKVRECKDFCNVIMPSKNITLLEFIQNQKSDKTPFIIYADLECII